MTTHQFAAVAFEENLALRELVAAFPGSRLSLRELRVAGVIATAADRIVILDATRLYAESGGSTGL